MHIFGFEDGQWDMVVQVKPERFEWHYKGTKNTKVGQENLLFGEAVKAPQTVRIELLNSSAPAAVLCALRGFVVQLNCIG